VAPERWRRILEEEPRTLLGRALDFPYPEICDAWEVPSLGETFRSPVQSRVPALFISGTLDARTPLDNAREVARGFVDGRELLIEGGGHGDDLLLSAPEIGQTLARFLRGEPVRSAQVSLAPITFQVLDPPPVDEPVSIP
jgi:pimeloyl-ACP methyl ester carboxylesterase